MLIVLAQRKVLYQLDTSAIHRDPARAAAAATKGVDVVVIDRHDLGPATADQEAAFEVASPGRLRQMSDDLGIVVLVAALRAAPTVSRSLRRGRRRAARPAAARRPRRAGPGRDAGAALAKSMSRMARIGITWTWQWGTSKPAMISPTRSGSKTRCWARPMVWDTSIRWAARSVARSIQWSTSAIGTTSV